MFECLILGDSLAIGAKSVARQCRDYTKSGITSRGWSRKFGSRSLDAGVVIISLGSNDSPTPDTYPALVEIRAKIKDAQVFWIQPNAESRPKAAKYVQQVADEFGDTVIKTTKWQPDKIHPTGKGYQELVKQVF
jgi:lysophospholipase L1-like esterase